MALGMARMPKFDPMDLVVSSKNVCGFNLSFFADETALVASYMDQIVEWVTERKLRVSQVTEYALREVPRAHTFIQQGKSIGKLVLNPPQV